MFHEEIIERRKRILERRFGIRLHEYSIDESRYVAEVQLENKRNLKTGKLEGLTQDEQLFITNEVLVSRANFKYWFERYPQIVLDSDTGEKGHPKMWASQTIMLNRLAKREKMMWEEWDKGHKRFDGNRWYVHKARQMGLSSICQGINVHAVNFYSGTNCLVGSTTLPKTQELHRDYGRMMWDTQPDWMKVPAFKDHQEQGLVLHNGSKIILQHSEMESGFGQGAKWHRAHLTEIASWKETGERNNVVDHIDNHFDPAVSRSIKSAVFLESTSQGMDNYWHRNTERARAKRLNWWWYLFIPWWLIPNLYVIEAVPEDWNPAPETLEEEETIIRSSPEWTEDGKTYTPSLEQMYWWEKERTAKKEKGLLNEFYKNYPSIPEQSFTHSGRSSFSYDTLTWCGSQVRNPYAYYDIVNASTPPEMIRTAKEVDPYTGKTIDPPPIYDIGKNEHLAPVFVTEEEKVDPRGLVLVWEKPDEIRPFDIFAGVDTTGGIDGWSRHFRRESDEDINNAAISLIRAGSSRDVDVLEFAAPITAKPLARLYNAIGRIWTGRNHMDGQTPTIVELTGEGMAFQEELISEYDFWAFYQHFRFTGGDWQETQQFGWKSDARSIRHLWTLYKEHVGEHKLITRSKYLVREMHSCTDDMIYVQGMTRGKAPKTGGRHDDRVYSRAFAVWYANSWANPDPKPQRSQVPRVASEGVKKVKLHQMDFRSPEEREAFMEQWEAEGLAGRSVDEINTHFRQ